MATPSDLVSPTTIASASFDRSDRQLTVYLTGELDAASTPVIWAGITDHLRPDDDRVWLDMSRVTFCDSSGLMMLFRLNQLADDAGTLIALYELTPAVRRVIEICDVSGVLRIRT